VAAPVDALRDTVIVTGAVFGGQVMNAKNASLVAIVFGVLLLVLGLFRMFTESTAAVVAGAILMGLGTVALALQEGFEQRKGGPGEG
jgi:hypothetical protein